MRDPINRASRIAKLATLRRTDTVVVTGDPLLRPTSVLLDTSIWEASLCHVQTTDLRNLAHGRHGWLHHRLEETLILALVGTDTRVAWTAIESLFPTHLRLSTIYQSSCGRLFHPLPLYSCL